MTQPVKSLFDSPKWSILHVDLYPVVLTLVQEQLVPDWERELEILGFNSADEAARCLLHDKQLRFDLAIIDAALESGTAAADLILLFRDCHPDCPVLLTRYPDMPGDPAVLQLPDVQTLSKPFSAGQLRAAVRKFLECSK